MAAKKLKSSSSPSSVQSSTKPPPLQLEEEEEDSSPDNNKQQQQQHSSSSSSSVPEIPSDLVQVIISRLSPRDKLGARFVCKLWRDIATPLCKKPMWLMFFPKSSSSSGDDGDSYQFFDPFEHKSCWLKYPELRDSKVCYAEYGWLLLYRHSDELLFFFNLYTRESIHLPKLRLKREYQIFAFSAPPTSSDCLVFSLSEVDTSPYLLAVSTCLVGTMSWSTVTYQSGLRGLYLRFESKVVVCKGRFYCLDSFGGVGVYDPTKTLPRWTLLDTHCPYRYFGDENFAAEYNGDVYVLNTLDDHRDPVVYKLRRRRGSNKLGFVKTDNEGGGVTFFAGCLHSHAMDDIITTRRNSTICYPELRGGGGGRMCVVTYSLDEGRYYPINQSYDWGRLDLYQRIWIQSPPHMFNILP